MRTLLALLALLALLGASCTTNGSDTAPPPSCEQLKQHINSLYTKLPKPGGLPDNTQTQLAMEIRQRCPKMTDGARRCVLATTAFNSLVTCDTGLTTPKDSHARCDDAAFHWADYVHNNVKSRRSSSDWKDVRADINKLCEREQWSTELRDCWATITDVASHEKCLAMRKKR